MEREGSAVPPNAAPEASAKPMAVRSAQATTADSAGSGASGRPSPQAVEASGNALPAAVPEKPAVPAECIVPLEKLCPSKYNDRECDLIRESVKDPSIFEKGRFFRTEFGTCGEFRYTFFGNGYVSYLSFYDKRGDLKGVLNSSDHVSPPCMGKFFFGEPIECSREAGKWYPSETH
jgi:hypothetical protein